MSPEKKVRVTIDLKPQAYERLQELEKVTNDSKADVVRKALQLYHYLSTKVDEGCQITVTTKDGTPEKLVFLSLFKG